MELTFGLSRESGFRYTCNRCTRCCHHKRIMLNPYELLRLARNRSISVEELIREYTDEGGTVLRFEGTESACVFLGPEGCTVHPDRPLVCRLYPLGRYAAADGTEDFAILEGHPESAGTFATPEHRSPSDTVGAYLAGQDIGRHERAAERYYALFQTISKLAQAAGDPKNEVESEGPRGEHWLHVDAVAAQYCRENNLDPPESAEDQMEAHIAAVIAWARRNYQ